MRTMMIIGMTVALVVSIAITLQGCGGGSTTTTTAKPASATTVKPEVPTTTGAPTTTTTTTTKKKTMPKSGKEMAANLNAWYNSYNKTTKEGELGVYITMQSGGDLHHYCKTAPCFHGHADCILSVALYNRHMLLDGDQHGAHMKVFAGRSAGYVINTTLAEERYNRCAYIFDGASSLRLNNGCGDAAPAGDTCKADVQSAYNDICKSGEKCKVADDQIQPNSNCKNIEENKKRPWPKKTTDAPCYFTGPAFDYPNIDSKYDRIRDMIEYRIQNQAKVAGDSSDPLDGGCPFKPDEKVHHCADTNRLAKWNEIVMDLRVMMDDLHSDPNPVIIAFVYVKGHKEEAKILRKKFQDTYGAPGNTPLIHMDVTVDVMHQDKMGDPFVFDGDDESIEIV